MSAALNIGIAKGEMEHAFAFAPHVIEDVKPWGFDSPLQALICGVTRSAGVFTMLVDGEIAAMFGVVAAGEDAGDVWFLMGRGLQRQPRALVRALPYALNLLGQGRKKLVGRIAEANASMVRMFARAGFHVEPPVPYGASGLVCHRLTFNCGSNPGVQ